MMTTPYPEPGSQPQPAFVTGPEDVLAQRPATIAEPVRAEPAPRGRPSVTTILAAVVAAALLFAGGLLVGHTTAASAATTASAGQPGGGRVFPGGGAGGAGGGGGANGANGFTAGQVTAIDGSTLTITTASGTTVKVTTTPSTTVTKTATSDVASLKVGETVTVVGPAAGDGSVAAQRISEGAAGLGLPRTGQRGGAPTPTPTS